MKSFSIAFLAIALVTLVSCSSVEQVEPLTDMAAVESSATVVAGKWEAQVFFETDKGKEVFHSQLIPNTADFWIFPEEGTHYPNLEAITAYFGPVEEWLPAEWTESAASMRILVQDLTASAPSTASGKTKMAPAGELAAVACYGPDNAIGMYMGIPYHTISSCTSSQPVLPGYCIFYSWAHGYIGIPCTTI